MQTTVPKTVVAALIWQQGGLLICQRRADDHFPGKWEFPGGKVEPGESPRGALERELAEELGIRARIGDEVWRTEHQYPGLAPVRLLFFAVVEFFGTPENRVFEQICWMSPQQLGDYDFLEADRPLIERIAVGKVPPPDS